jgi:hypothetical protein
MCKCKSFTFTQDVHFMYMAIDIYMHNTKVDLVILNGLDFKIKPKTNLRIKLNDSTWIT